MKMSELAEMCDRRALEADKVRRFQFHGSNRSGKWDEMQRRFIGFDYAAIEARTVAAMMETNPKIWVDEAQWLSSKDWQRISKGAIMKQKKVVAPKPPKDLLSILLQLITSMYPDDRLAPGIVQSYLGGQQRKFVGSAGGDYYASIKRYPARTVMGNEGHMEHSAIVATAYGTSAKDALKKLGAQIQKRTALATALGKAVGAKS